MLSGFDSLYCDGDLPKSATGFVKTLASVIIANVWSSAGRI